MSATISFVKMDGGQGEPIRSKAPVSQDIVFVSALGAVAAVARAGYVRFNREADNQNARGDSATVISIIFPGGTWRIRGNRVAMDLVQKLFLDHLLHWVEVTPNADPDRDEQSKTPVIYTIMEVKAGTGLAGTKKEVAK